MPKITLLFKDIKIREYPITEGLALNIGRKHSNDIVIDNPAVSGNHARIEQVASTFVLRDLDSTNGTFVNEERVSMQILKHNDVIFIGNHKLILDCSDQLMAASKIRDDYDVGKTRILNVRSYHDLSRNAAEGAAARHPQGSGTNEAGSNRPSFFARLMKKIFG